MWSVELIILRKKDCDLTASVWLSCLMCAGSDVKQLKNLLKYFLGTVKKEERQKLLTRKVTHA